MAHAHDKRVRTRRPTDVHPKVVAGTIGAGLVAAVLAIFGIDVSDGVAAAIAAAASFVLGWAKTETS